MKPILLEMQAFGPFAQHEVLDLGAVADRQLVLIHGPTGSGKTTLLDAMCFALFGDTSGAERLGKQMRCAYASPALRTFVSFEFRLGTRRFRVRREPEQERPKMRGDGVTIHKHVATVWETTESGPGMEGRLIASGAAEVGTAVQSLVGFDANQFRQVVVLPQGRFRQFLVAGADEKEKILETLFRTHDYARVADALQERARELEEKVHELASRHRELLSAVNVASADALRVALDKATGDLEAVRATVPKFRAARREAQQRLEQGQRAMAALSELDAAGKGLAELEKREARAVIQRKRLAFARAAEPLVELYAASSQRAVEAKAEVARRDGAHQRREAAKAAKQDADERFEKENAREKERAEAAERVNFLRSLREPVDKLAAAVQALEAAAAEENRAKTKLEAGHAERTAAGVKLEAMRARFESATSAASKAPALALELDRLSKWLELKARVHQASIALRDKTVEGGELERDKKLTRALQRRAKKLDKELTEAWKRGRAGALARSLVKGKPCPVCGSSEHPTPAAELDSVPSDDEVDTARAKADQSQRKAYEVREKFETCQVEAKAFEEQVRNLRHDLGDGVNRTAEQLAQLHADVSSAQSMAEKARASLPELERTLVATTERATVAARRVDEASESFTLAKAAAELARSEVERIQKLVPAELRLPSALAKTEQKAGSHRLQLGKRLEDAANLRQSRATELSRIDAQWAACADAATRALSASEVAKEAFDGRLQGAGFADVEVFLKAAKVIVQIAAVEEKLLAHDRAMQTATERLARAKQAAEKLEPVSLEALTLAAEKSHSAYEKALRSEEAAQIHAQQLTHAVERIAALDAERAQLDASYQVVAPIAKVARGTVEPRISFQRFVLASFLDEVLSSATTRLSRMSKGRYALHRTEQAGHRGRAAGLDLAVTDTYTGTERPVTTLSGGESFLAALALSLGLADVVQQHAGGIHLETLFVDEGFGTLDPESLEHALDTLAALGNARRLVGIISHVPELQQRIATRIEVMPKRDGSTTRLTRG